ncbi:hypothetical protein B0H13DRAFT_2528343 [Mycena leptocephala]|nr:hypothetical protein B0H13DRAFT_2528343 [Mycena leptocephala]
MRHWILPAASFFLWPLSGVRASPWQTFDSISVPDSGLKYVKNSGICETTTGVDQISGLNGGPGMMGVFQGILYWFRTDLFLNNHPTSWNKSATPIGAGFSTGTGTVNSTDDAAKMMWTAFQILYESSEFSAFQGRDLIFATESYERVDRQRKVDWPKIIFTSLMINERAGIWSLQNASVINAMSDAFFHKTTGCQAQLQDCYDAGTKRADDDLCAAANDFV